MYNDELHGCSNCLGAELYTSYVLFIYLLTFFFRKSRKPTKKRLWKDNNHELKTISKDFLMVSKRGG